MTEATTRQRPADGTDARDPRTRVSRLFDRGSMAVVDDPGDTSVLVARGRIDGIRALAYCTDATSMGGAIGGAACERIAAAIDTAVRERCPVIGLWHSGGARLREGVQSMEGMGRMFSAMIRASGQVPQLSLVLGPAAGGAAYGSALTDLVIMAPTGRMFVTGPDVVRSVTGEQIDIAGLGGPEPHGRKSGVAHVVADSAEEAYAAVRRITTLLVRPGFFDRHAEGEPEDLRALLPEAPQRAYDVRPLVRRVLDRDGEGFQELQARWAPNVVVGLGRLTGRTVGVVANNPLRKAGCLDTISAEKAARFVRMCDSFGIPLVVIVDVPGYLPGVKQEWEGLIRRGAKLLYAFGEAVVPRVTLVTRKSYGGAYIAMNSRSLGATAVFAWPEAEIAVMGAESAVRILHRKELAAASDDERDALRTRLTDELLRTVNSIERGLSLGAIDEVIDPRVTRPRLAQALREARPGLGRHGNIPL